MLQAEPLGPSLFGPRSKHEDPPMRVPPMIHEKEEDRSHVPCAQSHSRNHSEEPPATGGATCHLPLVPPGSVLATRRNSTTRNRSAHGFLCGNPTHVCFLPLGGGQRGGGELAWLRRTDKVDQSRRRQRALKGAASSGPAQVRVRPPSGSGLQPRQGLAFGRLISQSL